MLLVSKDALAMRAAIARGPLAPLADSLAKELDPLFGRPLYIPKEKALLSRRGGRCEHDGASLEFDPFSPHNHCCPQCGRIHRGEFHDRWWAWPYQLWLAERAVHGALLYALRGDQRHARLAHDILGAYAQHYLSYPNRDNVLGPTRLFFSTYLESIWLLQVCVAVDALEASGDTSVSAMVREQVIEPSATLVAQYDEGLSNRQVWNNAALMAAALVLGRRADAERIVHSESGLMAHLANGLLPDGTWYEGDNYHAFAHRGLWYGLTMATVHGIGVDDKLVRRFDAGFAAPFAVALPDFTLPSRKDSQYAISLHQWRFAEFAELGIARNPQDRELNAALSRVYDGAGSAIDTGRARSTADTEHNGPATRLTRADLGWRALLHALPELPALTSAAPRSVHLPAQGFTAFRRDAGDVYVAFDWGQSGGGHGHPDRLNVLFANRAARWLDDLGTGSYVDRSLHWYRSTLAHNTPLADGHSQHRVDGTLLALDERGGFGWAYAEAEIALGVIVRRALIVTPDYFVDELRWEADHPARLDLPLHFDGAAELPFAPANLDGGSELEDGFDFVTDPAAANVAAGQSVALHATRNGDTARAWISASGATMWFRATAPSQPASTTQRFYVVRSEAASGTIRSVWAWSSRVTSVAFDGDRIDVTLGNERQVHSRTPEFWQIELSVGGAHSGIELTGWTRDEPRAFVASPAVATPPRERFTVRRNDSKTFELGEQHYRRSDQTWHEAGKPTATVRVTPTDDALVIDVDARTGPIVFVPENAENPYDNESPDINGHGVQLYVRTVSNGGAWIATPRERDDAARVRGLAGWGTLTAPVVTWRATTGGFAMSFRVALSPDDFADGSPLVLDVIVNETEQSRKRRRGQLVASGAAGEFVYLRGDRHPPGRFLFFTVRD